MTAPARSRICPICRGSGTDGNGVPCKACNGTGEIPVANSKDDERVAHPDWGSSSIYGMPRAS